MKTVEESAHISGFDAHKHVKGRKRHVLVDTLGLLLAVYVTPADMHDTLGARRLLAGLAPLVPRLQKIWADEASAWAGVGQLVQKRGQLGAGSGRAHARRTRVQRPADAWWVVERTFGWLSRSRRLSKDYERKVQTRETLIQIAMIRLLIARLGRSN